MSLNDICLVSFKELEKGPVGAEQDSKKEINLRRG